MSGRGKAVEKMASDTMRLQHVFTSPTKAESCVEIDTGLMLEVFDPGAASLIVVIRCG